MLFSREEKRELNFLVERAFEEDCVFKDAMSSLLPVKKVTAEIISRENCLFCGKDVLRFIFGRMGNVSVEFFFSDGEKVRCGSSVARVAGFAGKIFPAERTALNFISFLSGIATKTAFFVDFVRRKWKTKKKPVILDTRKTLPGWRYLSKYAVRIGGGKNHRINLKEIPMAKDNHFACFGAKVLDVLKGKPSIVEADTLLQVREILKIKPDVLLCDNFSPSSVGRAIELRDKISPKTLIEISGSINEKSIARFVHLPVDRISIGALTHSVKAIDFSLEVR